MRTCPLTDDRELPHPFDNSHGPDTTSLLFDPSPIPNSRTCNDHDVCMHGSCNAALATQLWLATHSCTPVTPHLAELNRLTRAAQCQPNWSNLAGVIVADIGVEASPASLLLNLLSSWQCTLEMAKSLLQALQKLEPSFRQPPVATRQGLSRGASPARVSGHHHLQCSITSARMWTSVNTSMQQSSKASRHTE
jgi:hypothetical protein